ncbi:histidine kinase [Micromonospora sp. NPDC049559]|uniref:sensor histidine kinase n=1 Tax=Micromonospora sp. NPDC049559 TaxID=3155923 RepID=UPI00343B55FA
MRRWVVEAAVVSAVGAVTAYRMVVTAVLPGDRAPDPRAYAIALAMTLALLARRRWPAAVLALVGALFLQYHMLGYPGGVPAVPVWVALYAVAAAPRRRAGLAVAAALIVLDAYGRMTVAHVPLLDVTLDGSTVVFVAALLLGEVVRGRRQRLALLAAERDRAAELRVTEERIRIARELHDITAHTLAVVGVQAGVAAELLDDDPALARDALAAVRRSSREAMVELRAAVGVLRDGTPAAGPAPPAPGLGELPALAAATGAVLAADGEPRALPRAVEFTAYRIVQEAVANALRHAAATRIEVRLGYRPDGLALLIRDDGGTGTGRAGAGRAGVGGAGAGGGTTRPEPPPAAGNGLRGMVERAEGLGGWVRAGPATAGGFEVRGWLPT